MLLALFGDGVVANVVLSRSKGLSEGIATAALVIGLLSVLTTKNQVPNSGFETGFAPLLVGRRSAQSSAASSAPGSTSRSGLPEMLV